MDIRSALAAQQYTSSRAAASAKQDSDVSVTLGKAAEEFAETLKNGEQVALKTASSEADTHALIQALAQTELAVETAVTVRDKVVEAYQEILRMPV